MTRSTPERRNQKRTDTTCDRGFIAAALLLVGAAPACTTNHYMENRYEIVDAGFPVANAGSATNGRGNDGGDGSGGNTAQGGTDGGSPVAGGEASGGEPATGGTGGSASDPTPVAPGFPIANTTRKALELDVFGEVGNHYWFAVSEEQLERMNEGGFGGPWYYGDIYSPQGDSDATYVDHLLVTPVDSDSTADFGKVQARVLGQSTYRQWTKTTLPNIKIDSDEFIKGNRIGGVKHMRFNNALVGTIYGERLALTLYDKMGYPAPRANYAWVSSNVWSTGVSVPYVLVESYKPQFCKLREDQLEGGCVNMWEYASDFGSTDFDAQVNCQFSECDSARVKEFEEVVLESRYGGAFKESLDEWLDWDAFHQFQCLSWILATGDDAIHGGNNTVLVERADGKFQFLPYSVDISLGQEWYPYVSLAGHTTIASGCQEQATCWADLIATCEMLLDDFVDADPVGTLDELHAELEEAGMLRSGDDDRYEAIRVRLEERLERLPEELELNRDGPYVDYCYPQVSCNGWCVEPGDCNMCEPGGGYAGGGGDFGGFGGPGPMVGMAPQGMPDAMPQVIAAGGRPANEVPVQHAGAGSGGAGGTDAGTGEGGDSCIPYPQYYEPIEF